MLIKCPVTECENNNYKLYIFSEVNDMRKGFFGRITSMALVLAMLIGAFTALAVTGSAGVAEVDMTPPEIVVEGPVDVWDKSTQTEPTQVDADGYVLITSAAEFMWFLNNTVEGVYTNYRLATTI